jgi:agmatine/peptidylarginine deiminase
MKGAYKMKNKLRDKIVLIIISIFLCTSVFSNFTLANNNNYDLNITAIDIDDTIEITYNFDNFIFTDIEIDGENYKIVELAGESNIKLKDYPDLPNIRRSILIPDNKKMDIEIIDTSFQEYNNIKIAPSKGILPRTINPDDISYVFADIYNEDKWFPDKLAELENPYIIRDFRGQIVVLNPFQYNAKTQTLRVYEFVKLKIKPVGTDQINIINRIEQISSIDRDYNKIYQNLFINYNSDGDRYTYLEEQGNMLVITYDAFWSTMKPFVDWKNMKGIPTEMINLSQIGSTATDIDTYIEDYYNNNGLTFVLLVGDIDQMPTLYYSGHGSDPSFTYIVGDDNYQDIFIGRLSAQDVTQLETQVERSIEYEKYPQASADWYHKGSGSGSPEGTGDDNEYDWEHIRNLANLLLGYTYTWVDEFYGGSQGGNDAPGEPDTSNIVAALNEGRGIFNHCGHGANDGIGWGAMPGWYVLHSDDIDELTNDNKLPFVVLVACNSGEFEHYSSCFSETWMRATNNDEPTGAIGVFASTQSQSWDPPMEAQDEIINLLVNEIYSSMGGLTHSGTMSMMDAYGSSCYDETNTWTLFGDPSLNVFTDTPASMTVNHDTVLLDGATSFDINVQDVEDALCAISYDGELLGFGYTDVNGDVTISFDQPISDIELVDLVVTAFNKITYITTLEVLPPVRQPAEFETMQGVLIRYPFGIPYDMIAEMSEDTEVITIVANSGEQTFVESQYSSNGVDLSNCSFLIAPSNSYWTRDYGPWFIYNQTADVIEVVNFTYNRPRPFDDAIPEVYANNQGLTLNYMDLTHAGGNYMTDGQGIAFSTSLVHSENPGKTPEEIEQIVAETLGISNYYIHDDPLGLYIEHIDCWAKLLAPDKIMIIETSPSHPQYDVIENAVANISALSSCYGTPYDISRVYVNMEEPYINSFIINDKILVPITGSIWDDDAIASYQAEMPGYEVLGFTGSWQNTDAIHCRVKGLPDQGLLYIDHDPLVNQLPNDLGFKVETEITTYSGASLISGSPLLYWKNSTAGVWNSIQMTLERGDTYFAYIPPHPCGETIYYYIHAEDESGRIEDKPYMGSFDPFSFDITLVPDIWISPLSFDLYAGSGYITIDELIVGNDVFAGEVLNFNLTVTDSMSLGWLSVNITQGSILPNNSIQIDVVANATSLIIGSYEEAVIITSDDPDEPMITIPVQLTVVLADDVGVISINSPTGLQSQGSHVVNVSVQNFGYFNQSNVLVNCTIHEGGIGGGVIFEDFSTSPTDWTITDTSGTSWTWDSSDERMENSYSGSVINSGYLDSPIIDLSGRSGVTLKYWHDWKADYSSGDQDGWVRGSIDGGSTFPFLIDEFHHNDPGTEIAVKNYSITWADNEPDVVIRFEVFNDNDWHWYIDDFNVSAEFMGNLSYTAETTVDIPAYGIEYVEFSPPWNANQNNIYGILATTLLTGDQNTANDKTIGEVEIFQDVYGPQISNIHDYPDPQAVDGFVNITCDVTDFSGVSAVYLNINGPTGFSAVNISMSSDVSGGYYYENNYSLIGNYTYSIWSSDTLGNGISTSTYKFRIISGDVIVEYMQMKTGWNLISLCVDNGMSMASHIAENITGCLTVNKWDSANQTYKPYIVGGPPDFDFPVSPGMGLFVETSENNTFIVSGTEALGVSVDMYIPWNLIGWYHSYDTTASSLAENITGCLNVNMWDSVNQTYKPYIVGGPPDFDFPIYAGMGLFIEVDTTSVWNGEG